MADNSDIIQSALRRAMRYENGDVEDFDLTPAYSTADIMRGVDPLAGVGSRLGTKWTSPAQDEAARQRFLEAEHKPTLIGKSLGAIGIDESGQRAATPWLDAFMSTLHMPSRFLQAGQQALTAPSRALTNDVSYYDTAIPQRDANGNEYISDMGPIAPGTAIPEGLNFAGTIASSSPIATATGAVPANTAGMFAGRLAKTADHAALAKAEKMAAEGLPREQIWKETGWFQGKDGKWRFEIDDRPSYIDMKHDGDFYRSFGYGLSGDSPLVHPELAKAYDLTNLAVKVDPEASYVAGSYAEGAPATPDYKARDPQITVKAPSVGELKSPALHEAQHHVQRLEGFQRGDAIRNHDPIAIRDEAIRPFDRQIQELMDADPVAAAAYRARNRKQAELRGKQWTDEDMAVMDRLDAELNATDAGKRLNDLDFERESVFARPAEFWKDEAFNRYMRSAGETEARAVEARRLYTPENRRAVPPWEDYDVPESQQIVRGVSSNPDGASIPGVVVRDAAEKPIRAYHGTNSDLTGGFSRIDPGNARGDAYYFTTSPRAAGDGYAMGNTNRITPKGDAGPNVVPVDIGARLFDENDIVSPSDRLKLAEAFNEKQTARAKERGRDVYPDELMNPDEFASTWFDRAYPAKGQNVLQSLTYDPNEQNALLSSLGYQGRTGYPAGTGAARAGQDIAIFPEVGRGTVRSATTGDILYSNADKSSIPGTLVREDPVTRALRVARSIDPLGYYSKLDEVLGGFRPTDKVTSQTLQQRGVKASEIEARGLKNLLADGSAVPVSELQGMAKGNGVGLNESKYGTTENWVVDPWQWGHGRGEPKSFALRADAESYAQSIGLTPEHATPVTSKPAKWSDYSLDKGNPSYRETVLHLPSNNGDIAARVRAGEVTPENYAATYASQQAAPDFQSGHWSEPNVIAHARTSIQKDTSGKNVFLVDELQSDWGQKIRDKGARDEGKIAELRKKLSDLDDAGRATIDDMRPAVEAVEEKFGLFPILRDRHDLSGATKAVTEKWFAGEDDLRAALAPYRDRLIAAYDKEMQEKRLIQAELKTAEAATPAHPLVSTTDQWTTTALRRLIKQAVDSGADAISFTPGKVQAERYGLEKHISDARYYPSDNRLVAFDKNGRSVLDQKGVMPDQLPDYLGSEVSQRLLNAKPYTSGMGEPVHRIEGLDLKTGGEGMKSTYDSMYPRTLGKILSKMDPSVKMETRKLVPHDFDPKGMTSVATGETDRMGSAYQQYEKLAKGTPFENDFITFPITDKIRKAVSEGQPLFSNSDRSSLPGSALRQGEQEGRVGSGKANKASDGSEEVIKRAINVSADEGAVEDALKVAKEVTASKTRKSSVAQMRATLGDERGNKVGTVNRRLGVSDYDRILELQRESEGMRAAMRDPATGKIYVGGTHQRAIDSVPRDDTTGAWGRLSREWDRSTDNSGFVDSKGRFITRTEAEKRYGVSTMEDLRDLRSGKPRNLPNRD